MNPARNDRAVIMARGLSSRMGVPKGLLRLSSSGPVFVRLIADLYLDAGFGLDVVTRNILAPAYRRELPEAGDLRLLSAEDGRDTAWTMLTAWRTGRTEGITSTHLWAHPVDLPLVKPGTIVGLREHSLKNPRQVIRPVWQGQPGHPVILPVTILEILALQEKWQAGPVREFLDEAVAEGLLPAPVTVSVADPGIVHDFDRPDQMNPDLPAGDGSSSS